MPDGWEETLEGLPEPFTAALWELGRAWNDLQERVRTLEGQMQRIEQWRVLYQASGRWEEWGTYPDRAQADVGVAGCRYARRLDAVKLQVQQIWHGPWETP